MKKNSCKTLAVHDQTIELKIRFRRSSQHNNNNNNKRSKGTNQQHRLRDHRSEEVKLSINLLRIHMSSSMEPGDLLVGVNPLSLVCHPAGMV
jgi:hypothetical protein